MNDRGHGWILFAAIVLGVAGIMRIFDAIWAFRITEPSRRIYRTRSSGQP